MKLQTIMNAYIKIEKNYFNVNFYDMVTLKVLIEIILAIVRHLLPRVGPIVRVVFKACSIYIL